MSFRLLYSLALFPQSLMASTKLIVTKYFQGFHSVVSGGLSEAIPRCWCAFSVDWRTSLYTVMCDTLWLSLILFKRSTHCIVVVYTCIFPSLCLHHTFVWLITTGCDIYIFFIISTILLPLSVIFFFISTLLHFYWLGS